jgi:NAD(P)-dependent dehydrogenase (short-subunit alcohol dehydrogenase family)
VSSNATPLEGRLALVTGGSRGIGAAITRKLAAWGCTVAINYVERDRPARALAEELNAQGRKTILLKGDVADPAEIRRMFATLREQHAPLDILVHNAASTVFGDLLDVTTAQWDYVLNTNARSTLLLAQQARPLMPRGARYITITNFTNVRYVARAGLFAAAKAALESLTRYLSVELGQAGIVVNGVRPGVSETAVFALRPDFADKQRQERLDSPWGLRVTEPQDCADVVALLCLPEAEWIRGQIIDVDGGYSLWREMGASSSTPSQAR